MGVKNNKTLLNSFPKIYMSSLTTSIIDTNIPIEKHNIASGIIEIRNAPMFNDTSRKRIIIVILMNPEIKNRTNIKTNFAVITVSTGTNPCVCSLIEEEIEFPSRSYDCAYNCQSNVPTKIYAV